MFVSTVYFLTDGALPRAFCDVPEGAANVAPLLIGQSGKLSQRMACETGACLAIASFNLFKFALHSPRFTCA